MPNAFDQFDAPAAGNAFDKFDAPAEPAQPQQSSWLDTAKEAGKGLVRGATGLIGNVADEYLEPFREVVAAGRHLAGRPNERTDERSIGPAISQAMGTEASPGTTAGKFAGPMAEAVGNPLSYLGPGGVLPKAVTAALTGAGSEAAGEMAEGSGYEPAARMTGAMIAGQVPRVAARSYAGMQVPPARAANAAILRGEGVEPTAGELTGSRALRGAEDELGNAPAAGGAFTAVKENQLRQFTRAVVRRMGINADNALPETIQQARRVAGARLESAARNMRIRMDSVMGDELHDLRADLMREGATPDQINRINQQLDNIQNGFVTTTARHNGAPDTIMDGRTYQGLTRHGTPLQRAVDDADPTVSYYATRIRSALDDAMERTAMARGTRPGIGVRRALEDLRAARRQWYNMMVISKAVVGPGEAAPAGLVTPQKLRSVLTNSEDRKLQYAAGRGDLADIARAGEAIMAPISTSNTSMRSLLRAIPPAIGAAIGQSVHGEPISGALTGVVAPGLAGRALLSRPVQAYLKGSLPAQRSFRQFLERQPSATRTALRSLVTTPFGSGSNPYAP